MAVPPEPLLQLRCRLSIAVGSEIPSPDCRSWWVGGRDSTGQVARKGGAAAPRQTPMNEANVRGLNELPSRVGKGPRLQRSRALPVSTRRPSRSAACLHPPRKDRLARLDHDVWDGRATHKTAQSSDKNAA